MPRLLIIFLSDKTVNHSQLVIKVKQVILDRPVTRDKQAIKDKLVIRDMQENIKVIFPVLKGRLLMW